MDARASQRFRDTLVLDIFAVLDGRRAGPLCVLEVRNSVCSGTLFGHREPSLGGHEPHVVTW